MRASLPPAAALLALLASCAGAAPRPAELTPCQEAEIGRRLWVNEARGEERLLTHWNADEDFASLGIGHFIWYPYPCPPPAGRCPDPSATRCRFTESFPGLLDALEDDYLRRGERFPDWLRRTAAAARPLCPWPTRSAFYDDFNGERLAQLRRILVSSVGVQIRYALERQRRSLSAVLEAAPAAERDALRRRYESVASSPNGIYALVDYVNFKGEGVCESETYPGPDGAKEGWGLLQVLRGPELENAGPGEEAVRAFSRSARAVLERRAENAAVRAVPPRPLERSRWLGGWTHRVESYTAPLSCR